MSKVSSLPPVARWLLMTQDQVLDNFQNLKGSYSDGKGQRRFVFIEGTRDDRALIIAHADTVWGTHEIKLGYHNNILYSQDREGSRNVDGRQRFGVGIGADDRAGCAIAWEFRKSGHSILITSGEEQGCVATKRIMNHQYWVDKLNDTHTFMVQFDRRGSKDLVFYDVATNKFAEYVKSETGYSYERGSCSDISHLAKKISAVNISTGYYAEHSQDERLAVDQWYNTLLVSKAWLSKPNLPKHLFDKQDLFKLWQHDMPNYHQSSYEDDYGYRSSESNGLTTAAGTSSIVKRKKQKQSDIYDEKDNGGKITVDGKDYIECKSCGHRMTEIMWYKSFFRCLRCKKEV